MGVFDIAVDAGIPGHRSEGGMFADMWENTRDIHDAIGDIAKDIKLIQSGVEDIREGVAWVARGAETMAAGWAGGLFSGLAGTIVGATEIAWGVLKIAWGVIKVIAGFVQLIWDILRLVGNVLQIAGDAAMGVASRLGSMAKQLITGEEPDSFWDFLDPFRWARELVSDALGPDKPFMRVNDYVRVPARGKGIVRDVTVIPGIGTFVNVKLNLGHVYVFEASSNVILLGHVYNSVRF